MALQMRGTSQDKDRHVVSIFQKGACGIRLSMSPLPTLSMYTATMREVKCHLAFWKATEIFFCDVFGIFMDR
jgi:hypothetical protein